jgi:WD40 repeat protein
VRNYTSNQVFRRIPLNYFPSCIALSERENYLAIGTKEGLVLFITRIDNSTGYNLDIYGGHYDYVRSLTFNNGVTNGLRLFSSSHSELLVWNIN